MQLPRATRLVVRIAGRQIVDHEGEVLDMLVQRRRHPGGTSADAQAA